MIFIRKDKRDRFINGLYAAIHTISGDLPGMIQSTNNNLINCSYQRQDKNNIKTYLELNPNKINSDKSMITSYSEFKIVLDSLFKSLGADIQDFDIKRADLSFNSNGSEDCKLYKKLYKLLICCIADRYNIKNCYNTYDLWTFENLSIAIKNDYIEAENYDKHAESHGTTPITNRFELRSKRLPASKDLKTVFLKDWCKRLDEAVLNFENVQKRYNDNLETIYKKNHEKYGTLTRFLKIYSDCIFTKAQLIDFFKRFEEVKNPIERATNFKKKTKVELFSKSDLKIIVKALKRCMQHYFNS